MFSNCYLFFIFLLIGCWDVNDCELIGRYAGAVRGATGGYAGGRGAGLAGRLGSLRRETASLVLVGLQHLASGSTPPLLRRCGAILAPTRYYRALYSVLRLGLHLLFTA